MSKISEINKSRLRVEDINLSFAIKRVKSTSVTEHAGLNETKVL